MRNTVRGPVNAADIITAYQEAFGVSVWTLIFDTIAKLFGGGGMFHLADQSYAVANEAIIHEILAKDKTDLEKYVAEDFDCEVPPETAYALGLFYADGSCGLREEGKYNGAWWRIVGRKRDCIDRAQLALDKQYPDMAFWSRLYDDYKVGSETNYGPRKHDLYCLEAYPQERHNDGTRGKFIEGFRATNYDQWGNKKVPAGILESPAISKRAYLQGVWDGDGSISKKSRHKGKITCHGIMQTTELIDLMRDCGWKFNLGRDNGNENYYITFNNKHEQLAPVPACDDFAFRLMGVFHQDLRTAAMPIFITWVSMPEGGHAVLSYYKHGQVKIIEPQNDDIYDVPKEWGLMLLCG